MAHLRMPRNTIFRRVVAPPNTRDEGSREQVYRHCRYQQKTSNLGIPIRASVRVTVVWADTCSFAVVTYEEGPSRVLLVSGRLRRTGRARAQSGINAAFLGNNGLNDMGSSPGYQTPPARLACCQKCSRPGYWKGCTESYRCRDSLR